MVVVQPSQHQICCAVRIITQLLIVTIIQHVCVQQGSAVADKPALHAASLRMCCKQIMWTLSVINLQLSQVDNALCRKLPFSATVPAFNLPHLHLVPPLGATLFEFCSDFWHQKTTVTGLLCGAVCMILHLAVSVEHWLVTDGWTDRDTQQQVIPALAMFQWPFSRWTWVSWLPWFSTFTYSGKEPFTISVTDMGYISFLSSN